MQAALAHGAASNPSRGFLEKILPSEGYYFAAELIPHGMRHHLAETIDELTSLVERLDAQGKTVFHACASYTNKSIDMDGKTKQRVQENVRRVRAFWLDLDVGQAEDKYLSQDAALDGLDRFLVATGLPQPMRVSSGYGVHVYWPLAEDIGPDQWVAHAHMLKGLCEAHGLKADHSRTTDHASILRSVGSHNRKDVTSPRPVELLRDAEPVEFTALSIALNKACSISGVNATRSPSPIRHECAADSVNAQFMVPEEYPDSHAEEIASHCNQIRLMRDTKGQIREPHWYAAIGVLGRTVEAPGIIHGWSNGHASYTAEETDRKIDRAMECGPTTCTKFGQVNPSGCQGCQHKGSITSPITLGHRKPLGQPSAEVIEFPKPFTAEHLGEVGRWLDPNSPQPHQIATPAPLFDLSTARIGQSLDTPPRPRRYLLKDCLPCGKVGAIVAPGGTGKSQFVLQLAVAVATKMLLAGHWEVEESGAVLGLFAEDDAEELHRRLHGIIKGMSESPDAPQGWRERVSQNLYIQSMVGQDNQMTYVKPGGREAERTDYAERLIATAKGIENLKLIIIDPVSRFRGGNENDAQDATRFIEVCELIAKRTGATVLILHHANKGSMVQGAEQNQSAARGSSAFTDGIRWQMNLATISDKDAKTFGIPDGQRGWYMSARVTKNNYAPPQTGAVFLKRGAHGYLGKVEPEQVTGSGMPDYLKVADLVAQNDGQLTSNTFIQRFGGEGGPLGMGDKKTRKLIEDCIERGTLSRDTKKHLFATDPGKAALSVLQSAPKGRPTEGAEPQ
jgi:hypothetical protein